MEFRQIHDFHSEQPIYKSPFPFSRGVGADHGKKLIFQAVSICKPGSDLKHECQTVSFFIGQFFNGLHQKIFGFLEVLSESGRQFVLFIFPDPLHSPVGLPDDMIPVGNNHSIFEAYLSNLPKVRIHITNKVFYTLSGFKL